MNRTKIEYLDYTWNPIVGCSGYGCAVGHGRCWAARAAKRQKHRCSLCYQFIPHWHSERMDQPLKVKKPSWIGCCFSGEFFSMEIADWVRSNIYMKMLQAHWHKFVILTKKIHRIYPDEVPENCGIGVSVNLQKDDWRIQDLLFYEEIRLKIGSFEPLYERIQVDLKGLGWIIIGGQTRPTVLPQKEWVMELIEQARKLEIPVFIKNNLAALFPGEQLIQEWPK